MAVKQVFETYVYDLGLSSVGPMPFVLIRVNGAHGKACGVMPQIKKCRSSAGGHGTNVGGGLPPMAVGQL
ncbi:hypothetical protein C4J90_4885 [Pseudomonas sp. R2-60-08W]|nr:hypothetical protein C4J90_4885 [Pseudomonas sp. R2-60-08W]